MSAAAPAAEADQARGAAISFLALDTALAGELAAKLEQNLSVFYFPHAQEELAGTDGLESMREPFLSARVAIVLYRQPWGETPWTRVEETAIKERCLQRGWGSLMFVQLDRTSPIPRWLPETHIRYVLDDYGLDGLVGAIKARIQEQGGQLHKPDALARAREVQRNADLSAEKQRLFRDQSWIMTNIHGALHAASAKAVALVLEGGTNMQPPVKAGTQGFGCILTDYRVSTAVAWRQVYANDVSEAALTVVDYRGAIAAPGERVAFVFNPEKLGERKFKPELSALRELVWVEVGKREYLSTDNLANAIAMDFFDLIEKVNQGRIPLPFT